MGKIESFGKPKVRVIFFLLLFVVILGVCTFLWFFLKKEKTEEVFDPNDIVTTSVDVPDEEVPKEYIVPADLPKRIVMPSIGVEGYIQLVSIDQYDRIAVPSNVHVAGWYINSAKPGEVGLSIIDGHRDGTRVGGIFRDLEELKSNDEFSIEYGDGSKRNFIVIEVKQVSVEDAYDLMYEKREGVEKQLNLVTCGGTYNKRERTYEDRIIVISEGI